MLIKRKRRKVKRKKKQNVEQQDNQQTIHNRVTAVVKDEAKRIIRNLNLSIEDVIKMLLDRIIFEQALPFYQLIPDHTTISAIEDVRNRKTHIALDIEDLFKKLNDN